MSRDFRARFRALLLRPAVEDEVESEIAAHLELLTKRYEERGMSPEQARRAALQRFGDPAGTGSVCREIAGKRNRELRLVQWCAEFALDVGQAFRQMFRQKGFTAVAAGTLALGIAAVTTVFSFLEAVVLRPLPFSEPDRVVRVLSQERETPGNTSTGAFGAWLERSRSFEAMTAVVDEGVTLQDGQGATRLNGLTASAGFFRVFGLQPALGRFFAPEEDRPGGERLAVLSHRLWTSRFGSQPEMVGRRIVLNAEGYTVIGVMPESFETAMPGPDVWMPLRLTDSQLHHFGGNYLRVYARLRTGVRREAADAEMVALSRQIDERFAGSPEPMSAQVVAFSESFSGKYRGRLFILFGAVGLVLLIACSNVGNLLLARGAARSREMSVRAALGAGRGRLIRQMLTESLLLAVFASALGLFLAGEAIRVLIAVSPSDLPRLREVGLNGATAAFAMLAGVGSSLLFGMAPAWRAAKADIQEALQQGSRTTAGGGNDRMGSLLIAAEVALSLVLLAGAAQLIQGAVRLARTPAGYEASGVLAAQLALPAASYGTPERITGAYGRVLEQVRAVPRVETAALGSRVPLEGPSLGGQFVREGQTLSPATAIRARMSLASPGYFRALRVPLVAGRDLEPRDTAGSVRVTVVNETFARRLARDGRVLGARIQADIQDFAGADGRQPGIEVVGVVRDFRDGAPWEETEPTLFLPLTQVPSGPWEWLGRGLYVVARTAGRPEDLVRVIRGAVAAVDPSLPLYEAHTMEFLMARTTAAIRLNLILFTGLGLAGMVLAAIGIYGVVSHFVARQTREIGVRLALGASIRSVLRLVIGRGMRPVAAGAAVGCVLSVALSRLLVSQLAEVTPNDANAMVAAVAGFGAVAFLACYLPARRASRVDPGVALRDL